MKKYNLAALLLSFFSSFALAAQEGDFAMSVGWDFVDISRSSSPPLNIEMAPSIATRTGLVPQNFSSPGTELTIGNTQTVILTLSYFMTDHWSVVGVIGVPPKVDIVGHGTVGTPGLLNKVVPAVPLGRAADNPVASALFWFPVVAVRYFFNEAHDSFRPYLGAGIGYNFYTRVRLNQPFEQDLKKTGGFMTLATTLDTTNSVEAEATASFRPAFLAGLQWNMNKTWSILGSVSYLPIKTDAIMRVKDKNGQTVMTSTTRLDIPIVASSINLGYVF